MNNFNPGKILEPGPGGGGGGTVCRQPRACSMQATPCLFLQERREGLESFQPSLKKGEKEEDGEDKKEDDDDEEEMKGKRRDEEDVYDGGGHDSQNSPWSLLPLLQLLL